MEEILITEKLIGQFHSDKNNSNNDLFSTKRKGYVYFLWNKTEDVIKIGVTRKPKERIALIKKNAENAGFPSGDIVLLGTKEFDSFKAALKYEQMLHQGFEEIRMKGEWYNGRDFRRFLFLPES